MDDDPTLVRQVLLGEARAFRLLVERHGPALLAWCTHLASDAHAAEDLAQETFLKAWRRLSTWDVAKGSLRAWLFAIARNASRNSTRRRRPAVVERLPEPAGKGARPREAEAFRRLDRALAGLPAAQQAAFLLAEVHGLSLAEVALLEGVPLGTVKSRISRAREALRRVLARTEETIG